MPFSTPPPQLHFYCEEPFKGFARIEGVLRFDPKGVFFEYAMTDTVNGSPKGSIHKFLPFAEISSIELRKQWLSASRLRFRAKSATSIDTYPTIDPAVFEVEISAESRSGLTAFHQALQKAFEEQLTNRQTQAQAH